MLKYVQLFYLLYEAVKMDFHDLILVIELENKLGKIVNIEIWNQHEIKRLFTFFEVNMRFIDP